MTNDYGQRGIELNDLNMLIVERTDPTDCELVQGCPMLSVLGGHSGLHCGYRPRKPSLILNVDLSPGCRTSAGYC
jgi:hypothetical protein